LSDHLILLTKTDQILNLKIWHFLDSRTSPVKSLIRAEKRSNFVKEESWHRTTNNYRVNF
jgi:hypothetical protein